MNASEARDQVHKVFPEVNSIGQVKYSKLLEKYALDTNRSTRIVYHYTNAIGLFGIARGNTLWATNLAYLNDRREYIHGLELFTVAIDSLIAKDPTSTAAIIAETLRGRLATKRTSDIFAVCLSGQGNQLSQWRGYGSHGNGYSIGFDVENLGKLQPKPDAQWVVYKHSAQSEFAELVMEYIDVFLSHLSGVDINLIKEPIAEILEAEIDAAIPFFKDESFAEEQEYRLIIRRTDLTSLNDVDTRVSGDMLVPFVKLAPSPGTTLHDKLLIKEVFIGPRLDYQKAGQSVDLLLAREGIHTVWIRESKIPFV